MKKKEYAALATASSSLGEPDEAFLLIDVKFYKHGAPMALQLIQAHHPILTRQRRTNA
jgi:hypothetical protein